MARQYINNSEFLEALVHYKIQIAEALISESPKPRVPEYIGDCLLKITENIAKRPNFSGYTFKEDMIGDAIQNCLLYLHNFNENASKNPFGYFSKIIWYAFLRRIEREATETYVKFKSLEASPLFTDHKMESKKFINLNKSVLNENTHHIIQKYEERQLRRKKIKEVSQNLTKLEEFME